MDFTKKKISLKKKNKKKYKKILRNDFNHYNNQIQLTSVIIKIQ